MISRTIAQYHIQDKLGEGGMGVVYLARDSKLNRLVAIKVLPPEKVADPERKARFIHEARAASALNHPNIVAIHDIVSYEGNECIVMEYVAGEPLSEVVKNKTLRFSEVLKISIQIADALAAAHAAGLIHRDLKPSNIMLTDSGSVKVLDFGLAKLMADTAAPLSTVTFPQTDSGMVVGTVGYMSPEQVRGKPLDRRSDIFNFGLVLYEMLAGKRAFAGDTSIDMMSAVLKEDPEPLPESVPAALRQVVAVCLEKNPADRFESARDLGFALRALSAGPSLTAALPQVKSRPSLGARLARIGFIALPVLAVLAAVFAVIYGKRPDPLDLAAYKFVPFATDSEIEEGGQWSPDGKSIAYLKQVGDKEQLMVRNLDSSMPAQITRLANGIDFVFFWSPDGSRIYFRSPDSSGNSLWSVGSVGGEPQLEMRDVDFAALSPDGKTLVFWRRGLGPEGAKTSTLWVSSPAAPSPRKYMPAPFEEAGIGYSPNPVRFSPDGSRIALSKFSSEGIVFLLLDWPDGAKASVRRIFANRSFSNVPLFDWMPDSRRMILSFDRSLWLGDTRTGELKKLTASIQGSEFSPSVSPDGRQVVFAAFSGHESIVDIPLDGSAPRLRTPAGRNEYSPSLTPSGELMAFVRSGELWLRDATADWERPIYSAKNLSDWLVSAVLSPDGRLVALSLRGEKSWCRIWVMPTAKGQLVLASPLAQDEEYGSAWSPDSSSLAYMAWKGGKDQYLAVMRLGSRQAPQYISHAGFVGLPAWSPDGRWIACGSSLAQNIVLASPDGKTVRTVPSPVKPSSSSYILVWAKDSTKIYVVSSVTGHGRLDSVDIRTGSLGRSIDLGPDIGFGRGFSYSDFGWLAPDGKTITTTAHTRKSDLWILEGFPYSRPRSR